MECPNCHTDNVEGARFCASCGSSLTSAGGPGIPSVGLADRGSRLGAAIIDGIIFLVAVVLLAVLGPALAVIGSVLGGLGFIAIIIYQMVLLTKDGQTLGKKALGIRIVKRDTGENGGFVPNVLLRLFVNGLLGFIPFYGLLDILLIFRGDRRCIHDMIAGTQVVKA
ncbi:MAG: RDD family protein [Chloroflexi bacterium]|nr:RDD family protein [Chloroflexota bacterium]